MISLALQHISKSYASKMVFRDISLKHNEGILGIAGSNGSGKSTLLKCVAGLLSPDQGIIEWKNASHPIDKYKLHTYMGYAAPYVSLYQELTVSENLFFLAQLRKIPINSADCAELIDFVDLSHVKMQPYAYLSSGQQQRARLASALFHKPKVLILDEPGSNLDTKGHHLIKKIVKQYKAQNRLVLLASNNSGELNLCDRILSVEQEIFI